MEAFRCIHASRLLLDHQLRGLKLSASAALARDLREILEDSTLLSFERIVDECLNHEVDCLLLSGDCLDTDHRGLRGPAALVRGIERLAAHGIPVAIRSSAAHWAHWPVSLRIPRNAHRLATGLEAGVGVVRRGRIIATIAEAEPSSTPQVAGRGWQIVFAESPSIDDRPSPLTVQIFDDPDPAQGIGPHETGSRGCALIEIDDRGNQRRTFLATAPIRWERFDLAISAETTRDDLLQEMAGAVEEKGRAPCERVWLLAWNLSGEGPLIESLADPGAREDLCAELAELDPVPNLLIHTHAMHIRLPALPGRAITGRDELAVQYAARIAERFGRAETILPDSFAGSTVHRGPWSVKLESLIAELDAGEVGHDATRMAMHWFAADEELSS